VTVVVRRPGPPLAGLVAAIVYRTGEQSRTSVEKILPGPETGLWVNLNRDAFRSFDEAARVHQVPGAMISGPTGRASVIEFEGHAHVSVAFALGAAPCFLAPPLAVLRDELVPLEMVCGGAGAAAGALARGSRVAEVADRLGLLPRTLRRRFTAQVGLTPKRFGRVHRLHRLVRWLDGQARVNGPNHLRSDVRA
jgi:AraC-like DNA-binding protein